jgi:hypothetical protein
VAGVADVLPSGPGRLGEEVFDGEVGVRVCRFSSTAVQGAEQVSNRALVAGTDTKCLVGERDPELAIRRQDGLQGRNQLPTNPALGFEQPCTRSTHDPQLVRGTGDGHV